MTIEGQHADAQIELRRAGGELGEHLETGCIRIVVRPQRRVAEIGAASGELACGVRIEPSRDTQSECARHPTILALVELGAIRIWARSVSISDTDRAQF